MLKGGSGQAECETRPFVSNGAGPGAMTPVPSQVDQNDNTRARLAFQRLQHLQEQQRMLRSSSCYEVSTSPVFSD
jgi:hypothetical protein